jgi:hypothetical protein
VFLAHGRRLASMTSFHSSATTGVASSRSVSSKSEKSSRSSQSPSVENLRHGMFFHFSYFNFTVVCCRK